MNKLQTPEKNKLKNLSDAAGRAFINQTDTYKQRLVYKLLSTIKAGDRGQFVDILLRTSNSKKGEVGKFMEELKKFQFELKTKEFEDIGYAIVIGIMSTYENKKEEQEE